MSDSELASKNPLRAMRFTKRFPSSSVGVLQIAAASDRLPTIDFPCSDPQPPFEDIMNWIKEACATWSARFDRRAQFIAIFREGACEFWTFVPHQPPQCVRKEKDPSLGEALEFANCMLFRRAGACVHATWQPRAKHLAIQSSRKDRGSRMNLSKSSLPRLQILTSLLAHPQELPHQPGRKLAEYLPYDSRTADEFLARYGWRLRYAKARWLIYCDGRWRIDGDNVSIVELFEEFRASLLTDVNQIPDMRLRRQACRRVAHLGSLPMLNRILPIANARDVVAIPKRLYYA